eukprot:m.64542 g.64542  ORF g.64542 m.64542 type:complete len:79 (+) comp35260_c0_seq4:2055-2291(+)
MYELSNEVAFFVNSFIKSDMIKDVIRFHIKSGGKLPKGGVDAPKGYNKLVKSCSAFDPASRPDFQSVIKRLLKDDTSY